MISEALSFWNAISGKVNRLIKDETNNAFRCERYTVTTAANGSKIGVTLPYGTNEVFLPYSREVADATVGTPVLVVWWGSMSNAKVYYYADGYAGGGGLTLEQIRDTFWPIGSYYWSDNDVSPASFMGGYWERVTGAFLLAATDGGSSGASQAAGNTGGEAAVTLTENEIPAHTHGSRSLTGTIANMAKQSASQDITASGICSKRTTSEGIGYAVNTQSNQPDGVIINATHTHDSFGGGGAHNNMPPYLSKYCWHRVAPPA